MKKQIILLVAAVTFACCSISNASITDAAWHADGDGKIICNDWNWNSATPTLWMYGDQYGLPGQPGAGVPAHMLGTIDTDTPLDPNLTLSSAVENDTGGTWNGYQVNVYMTVPFSFVTPGPSSSVPGDWGVSVIAPTGPVAGLYKGTLNFFAGTPVGIGGEFDFLYTIHFASATHYSFSQEMIPQFSEVPEPSTLVLAGVGSLLLALRLRRNSHKAV